MAVCLRGKWRARGEGLEVWIVRKAFEEAMIVCESIWVVIVWVKGVRGDVLVVGVHLPQRTEANIYTTEFGKVEVVVKKYRVPFIMTGDWNRDVRKHEVTRNWLTRVKGMALEVEEEERQRDWMIVGQGSGKQV